MDFVGLKVFNLTPGQWFDLGLLQTYKNQLLPNAPDFFSAGGSLARLPAQAVIGFNPTITLSMAHSDYANMHSTFQAQATAAVGLGPFTIGSVHSSTYVDKSSVQYDDNSGTIVISPPPTTVPVLLGMISSRLDV